MKTNIVLKNNNKQLLLWIIIKIFVEEFMTIKRVLK
jgi:hypothetical protein